jgi:hypothetical protein
MLERLFDCPCALMRQRAGPLPEERLRYLCYRADQGSGLLEVAVHEAADFVRMSRSIGKVWLPGHSDYVNSLAFSRDDKALVSRSGDTPLRLWDTEPLRLRSQVRRAAEVLRPNAQ